VGVRKAAIVERRLVEEREPGSCSSSDSHRTALRQQIVGRFLESVRNTGSGCKPVSRLGYARKTDCRNHDPAGAVAASLVAAKMGIRSGHVEAGLRSFDRTMPEEINRRLTDQLADFLFTPSADGDANLQKEGIAREQIFLTGNVMIDSLSGCFRLRKRPTRTAGRKAMR
jgi:hypothetical protein